MQVVIEKLDHQLRGIGYIDKKVIFVPKTLPGEVCEVKITKEKKNYLEGVLLSHIKTSEKRVLPSCPYFSICGGCDLEHMSYEDTIFYKKKMLEELFSNHLNYCNSILIEACDNPWFYRNKLHLKVVNGQIGFYISNTHSLVGISECKIAKESINKVLKDFSMYSFLNGEIVIRTNDNDEILLDLITEEKIQILSEFTSRHKIVGILQNHKCIYGEPFFYERRNGVLYQVSFDSFFQVNDEISKKLFYYVRNALKHDRNILDLYCGVGSLSLQVQNKEVSVTGIEVVSNAILNAIRNAKLNHRNHFQFHLGKVEDLISKIPIHFDTVIVDPPRSGLDQKTRDVLFKMLPNKILYVSCNPSTLLRDLKKLCFSYQIETVQGFDMFPYTKHVECICVLNRR